MRPFDHDSVHRDGSEGAQNPAQFRFTNRRKCLISGTRRAHSAGYVGCLARKGQVRDQGVYTMRAGKIEQGVRDCAVAIAAQHRRERVHVVQGRGRQMNHT